MDSKKKHLIPAELQKELSRFHNIDRGWSNSGKLCVLIQLIKMWDAEQSSNKLLVFSQTKKILTMVTGMLDELGITWTRMDGDVSLKQRMEPI